MGVEGLYKFINNTCANVYEVINITDIKRKPCIIDGMQHIYTQLIYMRTKNKEIINEYGKNISHIHGLLNSLTYYLKNKIIPIFVFDGKSPEIKRRKIEERKNNLRNNLKKLKELENAKKDIDNYLSNDLLFSDDITNLQDRLIFGTPPESINIDEELKKVVDIQEEYNKIYKKSIILKDYYICDWIQILELLGIPVIKAEGEADPLCAYLLNKNNNIFGIISDDSDMLVFGAPRIMRKTLNQQFKIIELYKLLSTIENKLKIDMNKDIKFVLDDLLNFSILLGTDYGNFNIKKKYDNSYDLLKEYIINKDILNFIDESELEKFNLIKDYYLNNNFDDKYKENELFNSKPTWQKPKLMELKKRLLELFVDEDYIDKNNELFDDYYNKYIQKYSINYSYINYYNKEFNPNISRSKPINIVNNKIYSINVDNFNYKDDKDDNEYNNLL
jgi:flap endonuclease-1